MNKHIIVAESSRLVKTYLTKLLEDDGYDVTIVSNGFEVIREIKNSMPDCILCSTTIPVLDGFEVSRIIKTHMGLEIPVLLYTITEETYSNSIIKNSFCDTLLMINTENPTELLESLSAILTVQQGMIPQASQKKTDETDVTISAINEISGFYQKENEYLGIVNSIFNTYEKSASPRAAALGILDILCNYIPYDAVQMSIVGGQRVHDFCRVRKVFPQNEIHDFHIVAHDRFLNNSNPDEQLAFIDCIYNEDGSLPEFSNNSDSKIRAVETATLYGDEFLGTITVGSSKTTGFTDEALKKFQYFAEKATPMITGVLSTYNMHINFRNLRKAFSSFVPPEIIDDLMENADARTVTTGEKRRVAVMTCDIRQFTNISEKNKAEDVVSFLNSYFTEMVEIIKRHGGSIDKFMGDAIMALFGAPISYEDNAQRAVEAAVEMLAKLPDIDSSKLVLPEGYDKINIGIGIHYGEVILGSIGCEDKKDYTVIGDSVNLASRMEGLTKLYGNHLLISDSVKQELKGALKTHRLDKVTVKGKKIPVWVYSVENSTDSMGDSYYENYDKAMELYEIGAWALASQYFDKAACCVKDSKAALLMAERCRNYVENPPENWNGAVILTSK